MIYDVHTLHQRFYFNDFTAPLLVSAIPLFIQTLKVYSCDLFIDCYYYYLFFILYFLLFFFFYSSFILLLFFFSYYFILLLFFFCCYLLLFSVHFNFFFQHSKRKANRIFTAMRTSQLHSLMKVLSSSISFCFCFS